MRQSYREEIAAYQPASEQEASDQRMILWCIDRFPDNVLTRENPAVHITSSGFIVNPALDRVLMIHHRIRDTWAWTGGHADGDPDLLSVAIREAQEETGAEIIAPQSGRIASLDTLVSSAHRRRGIYVSSHLHLSVSYILLCDEDQPLRVKPDENTAIRWFAPEEIAAPLFKEADVRLYGKLLDVARRSGRG